MKLYKRIEIYLKYDNMHTIRTINACIYINNHVNSCINNMLSVGSSGAVISCLGGDGGSYATTYLADHRYILE